MDLENLRELYTFAFAPLGDTLLGDVEEMSSSDFTPEVIVDELQFLQRLHQHGFSKFTEFLSQFAEVAPESAPLETSTAVQCLSAFLKRQHVLNGALIDMVDQLSEQYADSSEMLKSFEQDAKNNIRPKNPGELFGLLDLTPNCKWESVDTFSAKSKVKAGSGGRVEFKETTTVISEGGQQREEVALKVTEIKRKKQRNATGYQKFTFRDLGLSETELSFAESQHAASTSASSLAGRESHTSSDAESSTHGSIEQTSVSEECIRQEELNPFRPGARGSGSSVVFSFEKERQEIQDSVADPEWNMEQRHQRRFSRIRNRVPTGHPAMMKKSSDDLKRLVQDVTAPPAFDQETVQNTESNRRTSTAL